MSTLRQTHQSHMAEITGDQFQELADRLDQVYAEIRQLGTRLDQVIEQTKPAAPVTESPPNADNAFSGQKAP